MSYDRSHRVLEIAAICGHLGLTGALAVAYVKAGPSAADLALSTLTIVPAMLGADLLSAVVHFAADRFGSVETPIVGRNLIRSFREHHTDPLEMTTHDFVTIAGDTCLLTIPCMAATLTWCPPTGTYSRLFVAFSLVMMTFVFLTSQIHKWAHTKNPPRPVQVLQRMRILLRPEDHAKHHVAPHDCSYATTTGWLNCLLDDTRFFPVVESTCRWFYDLGLRLVRSGEDRAEPAQMGSAQQRKPIE